MSFDTQISEFDISYSFDSQIFYRSFYECWNNSDYYTYSSIKESWISNYHFLCKKCYNWMRIITLNKKKIKIICSCEDSPKEIFIKNIFDYIIELNEANNANQKFDYKIDEKESTNKNFQKRIYKEFLEEYIKNNFSQLHFQFDIQTIEKVNYISKKIKENKFFFDSICSSFAFQNNNYKIEDIKQNKDINISLKNEEEIFANFENEIDNNYQAEEKNYFDISIIITDNDFNKFPNYFNINNISFAENFIKYYYDSYNEIKIKYIFRKEKINNYYVKLFGKKLIIIKIIAL